MRNTWILGALLCASQFSCGKTSSVTAPAAEVAAPAAGKKIPVDTERGGLLFDNWKHDQSVKAPEQAAALPRLKDAYGWDLRGHEGLYGQAFAGKKNVATRNWLTSKETVAEIVELLRNGDPLAASVAKYGEVLDEGALWSLATFIYDVREGTLPRPEWIWTLSAGTTGNYRLNAGADVANGHALIAERCSRCHGDDGTEEWFDGGAYSLGSHARQKAYEDWAKLVSGHPGSGMGRQLKGDGKQMAQEALDMLAALCDRIKYPAGAATTPDVADGDVRCGAYLK